MSYVPKNLQILTAAYAGALAGMGASNRQPNDPNPGDPVNTGIASVAGAFAQEYDTLWGSALATLLDVEATQQVCAAAWQERAPQANVPANLIPANYAPLADALIAIVDAGDAYFAAQGIPSIPVGPGGVTSQAFVNVKVFGVVGDGVTDDGPAFTKAFAAIAGSGSSAWIPAGTYNIATLPVVPTGLTIWNAGAGGQLVTFTGANAAIVANQTLTYGAVPGTAAFNPAWYALTTIFVNPTSGVDTAAGSTSVTPLKTWAEVIRRYGSFSPALAVAGLVIKFQGVGHTDSSDPVTFTPTIMRGVSVTITGDLIQVWSGAVTLVAAKNRATPQLLDLTLPAGAAANQLLINTSRGNSSAFVYKASAGNWVLSQPMTIPAIPFALTFGSSPTEDNGWTTGNVITGNTTTAIFFQKLAPIIADANGPDSNALFVTQCTGLDPIGNLSTMYVNLTVVFSNVTLNRLVIVEADESTTSAISGVGSVNVNYAGGISVNPPSSQSGIWYMFAGIDGKSGGIGIAGAGYALDADIIMAGGFNGAAVGVSSMGLVFWDTSVTWQDIGGIVNVVNEFTFGGPFIWGPGGTLNVSYTGHLLYPSAGGGAAATFIQTAATKLELNGGTTAHSVIAGTPDVFNGAIALTVAHLDAAAGAAGFGGNAFNPGNASISNLLL